MSKKAKTETKKLPVTILTGFLGGSFRPSRVSPDLALNTNHRQPERQRFLTICWRIWSTRWSLLWSRMNLVRWESTVRKKLLLPFEKVCKINNNNDNYREYLGGKVWWAGYRSHEWMYLLHRSRWSFQGSPEIVSQNQGFRRRVDRDDRISRSGSRGSDLFR